MSQEYFIGVDPCGDDGSTTTACVIRKDGDKITVLGGFTKGDSCQIQEEGCTNKVTHLVLRVGTDRTWRMCAACAEKRVGRVYLVRQLPT